MTFSRLYSDKIFVKSIELFASIPIANPYNDTCCDNLPLE